MEKDFKEEINNNKNWVKYHPFIYNNKDKFNNKHILVYTEYDNKYNTIYFFTKLCKSLLNVFDFIYCNNIDEFIELYDKYDYYFFVNPESDNRTQKHYNFIDKIRSDDNKKGYLLDISCSLINNYLTENITIFHCSTVFYFNFVNRQAPNKAYCVDCLDHFINKNKDILQNKKVLVYDEYTFFNRIRTIFYFLGLCINKLNHFNYDCAHNLEEFNNKIKDYDIIFINQPYNKSNEYNNMMDNLRSDNNKRLYLFKIGLFYNEIVNGLYEDIDIEYPNYDKNEFLRDRIRFINREEVD